MTVKVSIIVRTHNEKDWIGLCLHEIYNQKFKDYEIILVDNNSKDNTRKIVETNFPQVRILNYNPKKYFPGDALNFGISKTKGKFIVMISGHCIPKHNQWLSNLVKNISLKDVAGVYGKQEPLENSDPNDIRDLKYIFGDDRKVQVKDPFFHNANSIIRKDLWLKNKFDQNTPHIEDRLWAKHYIKKGYKIIYEPSAPVFHHHGLNYRGNTSRINKISKILIGKKQNVKIKNIVAIIPLLKSLKINGNYIVKNLIRELKKIKKISKIFIINNESTLKGELNSKDIIFIDRGINLKKDYLGTDHVMKEIYKKKIKKKHNPSHLLIAEEPYILRPKDFYKKLIENLGDEYDAITPICKSRQHNIWIKNSIGDLEQIFRSSLPSNLLNHKIYQELKGLGYFVKSDAFEESGRDSINTKFFEVENEYSFKLTQKISESFN